MRVADSMTYDQVRGNIGKNRTQMSELQNQASTQKRVTKPSDDPVAASRVLSSRIDFQGNKQYVKNLNYAKSFLDATDQALGDVSENLMRMKELAISQSNDASANDESRRVVATEVEQIFNQIISIGNRKLGDRFIFGGFKTQDRPFDQNGNYAGDSGEMMLHIDKATFLPMNIAGNRVFLGEGMSAQGIVRSTQEQAITIEEYNQRKNEAEDPSIQRPPEMRGPAGARTEDMPADQAIGSNLFEVARQLEIALRTDDKQGVQDTLDLLDDALTQVVLARSQVGSRGMAVDNLMQSLEKSKVDNQVAISQHEDSDVFSTISDMNKTESTLQATLQTSGKLIQPSLLNFLR
ncbi:MAG: flagellar hook-associated protein FlgL [Bdellovibrionales bacterium]